MFRGDTKFIRGFYTRRHAGELLRTLDAAEESLVMSLPTEEALSTRSTANVAEEKLANSWTTIVSTVATRQDTGEKAR